MAAGTAPAAPSRSGAGGRRAHRPPHPRRRGEAAGEVLPDETERGSAARLAPGAPRTRQEMPHTPRALGAEAPRLGDHVRGRDLRPLLQRHAGVGLSASSSNALLLSWLNG